MFLKWIPRCLWGAMIALGLSYSSTFSSGPYAPHGHWGASHDLVEQWCGSQLRAMRLPSLWEWSASGRPGAVFRVTELPAFSPARSITIASPGNGKLFLYESMLNGRGGYEPGELAARTTKVLSAADATSFMNGLSSSPALDRSPSEPWSTSCGRRCLDGQLYLVEAAQAGQYRSVASDLCCPDDDMAALLALFLNLVGDRVPQPPPL